MLNVAFALLVDLFRRLKLKVGQGIDFDRLFHGSLCFRVGRIDHVPDRLGRIRRQHDGPIQSGVVACDLGHCARIA